MTYPHGVEPLLLLHRIIDIGGDEAVQLVKVVVFPLLALRLRVPIGIGVSRGVRDELLEELDRRIYERGSLRALALRANNGASKMLLEFREEAMERRAVDEDLQDSVRKAHVASVNETSGPYSWNPSTWLQAISEQLRELTASSHERCR